MVRRKLEVDFLNPLGNKGSGKGRGIIYKPGKPYDKRVGTMTFDSKGMKIKTRRKSGRWFTYRPIIRKSK
jgi:hypothetical protein